jgi:hypothetical protein
MSNLVKTNVPGIYKDTETNAFINMNEYVKPTKKIEKNKEINILRNEVNSIKNDLKEVKELLIKALTNGKI